MTRRVAARWLVWLAAVWLASGCQHEAEHPAVLRNTCLTDLDCPGRDTSCDPRFLQCVRARTVEPYQVVLQVQIEDTAALLDAGVELVAQATFEVNLDGAIEDKVLEIPGAVRAGGTVQAKGEMKPFETQVTLTPLGVSNAPLRSLVVNTSPSASDAGTQFAAPLNPDFRYAVRVQPLLEASTVLPPLRIDMYNPKQPLEIQYEQAQPRSARLVSLLDQTASWADHRVRLEERGTGDVVSSIDGVSGALDVPSDGGVHQGDAGSFTLYATEAVWNEPKKFDLAVSIEPFPRWQAKVMVEGTSFVSGPQVNMPIVPTLRTFSGTVEALESQLPLPFANMEFISDFPIPENADYVGNTDWCRLRQGEPAPLRCSARHTATTDANGAFEIELLPGVYRIVVTPDAKAPNSRDRATHLETLPILSAAEGGYEPQLIRVKRAKLYRGTVLSALRRGMPNVLVNARSLGAEIAKEGELSRYNRTASTPTNARGQFQLFVDVGFYDLSIETPPESGFAWVVCPNYAVRSGTDSRRPVELEPPTPVPLAGTVQHAGTVLPRARIEAFAVLKTKSGTTRLLRIGRAVSDEQGAFRLSMPPRVARIDINDRPDCPLPLELSDAGAESDAGMRADAATPDSGSRGP